MMIIIFWEMIIIRRHHVDTHSGIANVTPYFQPTSITVLLVYKELSGSSGRLVKSFYMRS
jgi:hypothetical protein